MTARETFRVLVKHKGLVEAIKFFFPIRIFKRQILIVRPRWYKGNFAMVSINKIKER